MSLGLANAGIDVVAACEKDQWAADTYARNHPEAQLFRCDIKTIKDSALSDMRGAIDIVAGGPPCQGFSVSGKRQYGLHLPSNKLVYEYIRVVQNVRPTFFILENVRGFTSGSIEGTKNALDHILKKLTLEGYRVYHSVIQAADYGVPSFRSRLFVIGSLVDLGPNPFPRPTHCNPTRRTPGLLPYVSALDAISDLPKIEAREGTDGFQPYTKAAKNEYQTKIRGKATGVHNHEAMKHSPRLVDRFKGIPQGGKGYDLGRSEKGKDSVTVYKSNNQRLFSDMPSLCITANFQSNYVHPLLHRNLTAREAARLMTFPDWFVFMGKRTLMSSTLLKSEGRHGENYLSQYNQLGNAVPPLLAEKIGRALQESTVSKVRNRNEAPQLRAVSP